MAYVIRETGKVEQAKPISSLSEKQKNVLKVSNAKQRARVHSVKVKLAASSTLRATAE